MDNKIYAEIVVDNTSSNTDKLFTYLIPKEYRKNIDIGMRVLVPFGRGNKLLEGIVLNIKENIDFSASRLKAITRVTDESSTLSKEMLELSEWMKDEYLCTHIEVLKTMMPAGITKKSVKYVRINKIKKDYSLTETQKKAISHLVD